MQNANKSSFALNPALFSDLDIASLKSMGFSSVCFSKSLATNYNPLKCDLCYLTNFISNMANLRKNRVFHEP
ncbi:hypothetical protein HK096_002569, partial [Nowakowskiella sp. JEL0078]